MIEIKEILYRWAKGIGIRALAESLGHARNTVREIVNQAKGFGLKRGSPLEQIEKVSGDLQTIRSKKQPNPKQIQIRLANQHDQIKSWLQMPYMTVVQMVRLLAEQGEIVSETSLRRYVKGNITIYPKTTLHLETVAGRQAQVDFGYVGMMYDPVKAKLRKTHAFVMILSHSRHRFVRFVFQQDVQTWIDCHIRAFEFFGGVPHSVLLDNLKSGINKPDIYDPIVNRAYGELEKYYGFVIDPTKVRTPRHKGKVERSIIPVKQQLIAGRQYQSIDEANQAALHWCQHEIANRVTRTTGRTPASIFIAEDKPALKPLPEAPFECPMWQSGKVHLDQHFVFKGSFYSTPIECVGKEVWIRGTSKVVQVFLDEQLIRTHPRAQNKGTWVTDQQHYPEQKLRFLEQDSVTCLAQAKEIGSSTDALLTQVLTPPSMTKRRKAQAILRLGKKYGADRLEATCQRAIFFGNLKYRSLKRILEEGLDKFPPPGGEVKWESTLGVPKGVFLRNPMEFSHFSEGSKK